MRDVLLKINPTILSKYWIAVLFKRDVVWVFAWTVGRRHSEKRLLFSLAGDAELSAHFGSRVLKLFVRFVALETSLIEDKRRLNGDSLVTVSRLCFRLSAL